MDDGGQRKHEQRRFHIVIAKQRHSQVERTQDDGSQIHCPEIDGAQIDCKEIDGVAREIRNRWREPHIGSAQARGKALHRKEIDWRRSQVFGWCGQA